MKEQRRLGNGEEIGERLIIKESYIRDGHKIEVPIQDRGVMWRSCGYTVMESVFGVTV